MSDTTVLVSATFYGSIVLCILWETVSPRRNLSTSTWVRWLNNVGVWLLNMSLLNWFFAGAALAVSVYAGEREWGLLRTLGLSEPISIIFAILLLDFMGTVKHRLFHQIPLLWRLHTLHHSDLDCDVSTTLRHHPLDYLLDNLLSLLVILAIGAEPLAIVIFNLMVLAQNPFRHSNICIPEQVDRLLRLVVVTPDFHRIHHSSMQRETNSNYSGLFPWWDWMMGTYCPAPARGQTDFEIGLESFRGNGELWLPSMLTQPFRFKKSTASQSRGPNVYPG